MDIHKILSDCDALENTISVLIKDNSLKEQELTALQSGIFDCTKSHLESVIEKEREFQCKLDEAVSKRQNVEDEIKQYNSVNEKLSELVSIAQKRSNQDLNEDLLAILAEANEEYSQVKSSFIKATNKLKDLNNDAIQDTNEFETLLRENAEILVGLHKNDNMIRLVEQQNKYAEQQFDLVLNQLPWEPLTKQYIEDLLRSSNQSVRDLTGTIQIQANEIEELNESIRFKKKKKLEALEGLLSELTCFVQRRDQAVIMARLIE